MARAAEDLVHVDAFDVEEEVDHAAQLGRVGIEDAKAAQSTGARRAVRGMGTHPSR
jgi:hypothetical protein